MPKPINYSEFREVVKNLIKEHYKIDTKSQLKTFESKFIDYVADSDYGIYLRDPSGCQTEYIEITSSDLSSFIRNPRAAIKIEKLHSLYAKINDAISRIYPDVVEPDEYGDYPECPEMPKDFLISSKLFRIKKENLPDLLEDIKRDDPFDLKGKEGELKEKNTFKPHEIKSIEETLSYDKTTAKFRFGSTESIAISKTTITRKRKIAEKLMEYWKNGKPCPKNELVNPLRSPLPQGVLDDISNIRKTLEPLEVNMPQSTDEGYSPPKEPKHFNITG